MGVSAHMCVRTQAPQITSQMSRPPCARGCVYISPRKVSEQRLVHEGWAAVGRLEPGACTALHSKRPLKLSPGEKRMWVSLQRLVKQPSLLPVLVLRNQEWEGASGTGYLL